MNFTKLIGFKGYQQHVKDNVSTSKHISKLEAEITEQLGQHSKINIKGFSWTAQSESEFLVELQYSSNNQSGW